MTPEEELGWLLCKRACGCLHCEAYAWRVRRLEKRQDRERVVFALVLLAFFVLDLLLHGQRV